MAFLTIPGSQELIQRHAMAVPSAMLFIFLYYSK